MGTCGFWLCLIFLCCKGSGDLSVEFLWVCKSLYDFVEMYGLQFGLIYAFKFGEIIWGKLEDLICSAGLEGFDC